MKRIVNGVTYNTDTATRLAQNHWTEPGWEPGSVDTIFGVLFQTRGGAFFAAKKITRIEWDERERREVQKISEELEPLSPASANAWLLRGDVEVFHNPFEDPPEATAEAEPGSSILILRCLEACLPRK
jgi:hypothetical protein